MMNIKFNVFFRVGRGDFQISPKLGLSEVKVILNTYGHGGEEWGVYPPPRA